MSPFSTLTCYISDQGQKKQKSNNLKKRKMSDLIPILVPIACGCVLPIMIIWFSVREKMNATNQRTQIVLAAIEKNPEMDLEELMTKISPKNKLLKEKLLSKLLWGCITAFLGIASIGFCVWGGFIGGMGTKDLLLHGLIGSILLAIGIAFLINYYVGKKMLAKEIEAEQTKLLEQA